MVKMIPSKPMCVEAFNEYPPLGRFAVRSSHSRSPQLTSAHSFHSIEMIRELSVFRLFVLVELSRRYFVECSQNPFRSGPFAFPTVC